MNVRKLARIVIVSSSRSGERILPVIVLCMAALLFTAQGQTVAPPEFEPAAADSPVGMDVVVSHSDPNAVIHYTLNGLDPVLGDPLVVSGGEVHIARTAILRARAWVGGIASEVAESEFRIIGAIAAGNQHGLAVSVAGRAWAWGNQASGRLGNGLLTAGQELVPTQVLDDTGTDYFETAREIAAGHQHSLILSNGGTVCAFGENGYGALGTNSTTDFALPVTVLKSTTSNDYLENCTGVAAGENLSLAVTSGGVVYSWGYQANGRLGNGSTTGTQKFAQPVQRGDIPSHPALDGIRGIAVGAAFGLAREHNGMEVSGATGRVWAWGLNTNGQLGQGNTTTQTRAVTVKLPNGTDLDHAWSINAGEAHTAIVRWNLSDPDLQGTVWTCGNQVYGRLGQGSVAFGSVKNPAKVLKNGGTPLDGIVQVAAGAAHTLALDDSGHVWAWGYNGYGQLGDGSTDNSGYAIQVVDATGNGFLGDVDETHPHANIVAIAAGGDGTQGASMALAADGVIWVWGRNNQGQLGNGETTLYANPLPVAHVQNHIAEGEPSVSLAVTVLESEEMGSVNLIASPDHSGLVGIAEIERIEFFVNGSLSGTVTQNPWTLGVGNLAQGNYSCYALVHDHLGAFAFSEAQSFEITADLDQDDDGLTDAEEMAIGSDPASPDFANATSYEQFTYDGARRLTTAMGWTYSYDDAGNIESAQ